MARAGAKGKGFDAGPGWVVSGKVRVIGVLRNEGRKWSGAGQGLGNAVSMAEILGKEATVFRLPGVFFPSLRAPPEAGLNPAPDSGQPAIRATAPREIRMWKGSTSRR